jgi:hypothetical protein
MASNIIQGYEYLKNNVQVYFFHLNIHKSCCLKLKEHKYLFFELFIYFLHIINHLN